MHDAMYYFHATAAQVKDWLSKLPVSTAECEGKTYFYIEINQTYDQEIPKCLFLAGFDQLLLAHEKKESLFLSQEHLRAIFNLAGIVMLALMIDGKVVGKWKKKNRKLTVTMFETTTQRKKTSLPILRVRSGMMLHPFVLNEFASKTPDFVQRRRNRRGKQAAADGRTNRG